MKKIVILILLGVFLAFPQQALAHALKSDGDIGAIVHVDPDDDPIVGEPTGFYFEFKDKTGKFLPQNCDCTLIIKHNGEVMSTQPLFANSLDPSLDNASVFYTFPHKGIYEIEVSGTPETAGQFQPFTLRYDLRVAKEGNAGAATSSTNNLKQFAPLGVMVFLAVIIISFLYIRKKRTAPKLPPKTVLKSVLILFAVLSLVAYTLPMSVLANEHHHTGIEMDAGHACCLAPTLSYDTYLDAVPQKFTSDAIQSASQLFIPSNLFHTFHNKSPPPTFQ